MFAVTVGRVEHEIDIAVGNSLSDRRLTVGARTLAHLAHGLHRDAVAPQHLGGACRRPDLESEVGEVIGFVVSSSCDYFASIAFPERIEVGLRVGKLGNSSVQYELAIFKQGEDEACAAGRFVHVFVDRASNRPVPIPETLRTALARLLRD